VGETPAPNSHHYRAADIIFAHSQLLDSGVEGDLRDIGHDGLRRQVEHANECGIVPQTLLAIVELWVKFLPTVHTSDGQQWLAQLQRQYSTDQ
jgi:hypothetical protein